MSFCDELRALSDEYIRDLNDQIVELSQEIIERFSKECIKAAKNGKNQYSDYCRREAKEFSDEKEVITYPPFLFSDIDKECDELKNLEEKLINSLRSQLLDKGFALPIIERRSFEGRIVLWISVSW